MSIFYEKTRYSKPNSSAECFLVVISVYILRDSHKY